MIHAACSSSILVSIRTRFS
ncbi:Agamous-like MADS-box protein AGL8 [Zea mays]|uniref:Agamous-like MADS-box protein AGL8 n=1 Tax=Zea mays TaxID=4577 RepID=A0A1D6IV96_MAIZE|nr:Agamous-like MADS-box protein AGL8 [Zea mays]